MALPVLVCMAFATRGPIPFWSRALSPRALPRAQLLANTDGSDTATHNSLEASLRMLEEAVSQVEEAVSQVACAGQLCSSEQALRIQAVVEQLQVLAEAEDEIEETVATDETMSSAIATDEPMSPAEARVATQADAFFSAIDENGDGEIEFDELEAHLSGMGFTAGAIEHIFDLLDVNKDGGISRAELRQSFVKYDDPALRLAIGLGAADADEIFDAIDENGDGEITASELAGYLELNSALGGDVPACATTIFRTLDVNGDGSISREELRQGYEEYTEFRRVLGLDRR